MPSGGLGFSISLAISLAESIFHWIHAAKLSSALPLVLIDLLRHHLVRARSADIMLAIRSGVSFHVSTPYNRHGFTSDCKSINLMACDVEVLLRSGAFACATFHACLNLCAKL